MPSDDFQQLGKGAIPREWDGRNIIYEELAGAAAFDWNVGFDLTERVPFKVEHQGNSLTCVGQAWAKYKEALDFLETNQMTDLSARFIYSRIFAPEGGAYIYLGAKTLQEIGDASEEKDPSYNLGNPPDEAFMRIKNESQQVLDDALIHKTKAHAYVTGFNIDSYALAVQNQNGLVTGYTGSWPGMSELGGGIIRPPKMGETTFGHAVYVVGTKLINGKKYLKFINSWGTGWGDNGYGYIGEEWFNGWLFNAITLIDLPNDWQNQNRFKHFFNTNLFYRQSGEEVRFLQKALKIDGTFPKNTPETGYYGPVTARAVLDFWSKYGVASAWEKIRYQGRNVGPKTRAKLNELFNV